MQRGYFVRYMDPDQLFEDEDSDGDDAYSERPAYNYSCCQCAIVTVLSSLGSGDGGQELRAECGRVLQTPRNENAEMAPSSRRTRRKGAQRGKTGHSLIPIVIDDSEVENELAAFDNISGVGQHEDSDYQPSVRPRKRRRRG
jgi:hypothetical protein